MIHFVLTIIWGLDHLISWTISHWPWSYHFVTYKVKMVYCIQIGKYMSKLWLFGQTQPRKVKFWPKSFFIFLSSYFIQVQGREKIHFKFIWKRTSLQYKSHFKPHSFEKNKRPKFYKGPFHYMFWKRPFYIPYISTIITNPLHHLEKLHKNIVSKPT